TRLSPITDVRIAGQDQLCAVDLAARRGVRELGRFRYTARASTGNALNVSTFEGGRICVTVSHVAPDQGPPDGSPERAVRVTLEDGVARGPLVAHLYDLGPARGFRLAGPPRGNPLPNPTPPKDAE